jgi:hypothetical protein
MPYSNDGKEASVRPIRSVLGVSALALVALAHPLSVEAEAPTPTSFHPTNAEWDGLSELSRIAGSESFQLRMMDDLDLSQIGPGDALLIVNPSAELPADSLTDLVRGGSRIALADDFGSGTNLFDVFQIRKQRLEPGEHPHLRSDPTLAFASPAANHALNQDVEGVVTNHPVALSHLSLTPTLRFGDGGPALVFAGVVGDGRFVAIGDPSIFINNMMNLQGNRRFGLNLLRYLAKEGSGTIWLVTPATRIGEESLLPALDFEAWLSRLAATPPPPQVTYILSILLAALCLILIVGSASRPETPRLRRSVRRWSQAGTPPQDAEQLYRPLMSYRHEFLDKVASHLKIRATARIPAFIERLECQGTSARVCRDFRTYANSLERLSRREPAPRNTTVGRVEFLRYVRRGENLVRIITGEAEQT